GGITAVAGGRGAAGEIWGRPMPLFRLFPAAFHSPRRHHGLAPPGGRLFPFVLVALGLGLLALAADPIGFAGAQTATSTAVDPGLRGGAAGAGGPLPGLTAQQLVQFASTKETFAEVDDVAHGLGPRFNLDSCAGCHAQPAIGGSSPKVNPQVNFASPSNAIPP